MTQAPIRPHSDNAEARSVSNSGAVRGAISQQYAREKSVLAPEFGYAERGYKVNPTVARAGGTATPANASPAEAFAMAGANFKVEKRPIWSGTHPENADWRVIDSHRAVHRTDTGADLGVVGKSYVPAQNASLLRLFEFLHEEVTIDNILLVKGGRKVFVTASINAEAEVVNGDPVRRYIHAFNSHDGNGSFGVFFSDMRLVCANQLSYLTGKGAQNATRSKRGLVVKHTKGITAFAQSLPHLVDIERQTFAQSIEEMKALTTLNITPEQAKAVLASTYSQQLAGQITDKETKQKRDKKLTDLRSFNQIRSFFRSDEGIGIQGVAGVEGTAYGLFNAITQFESHNSSTLRNDTEAARCRLESLWGGAGASRIETARKELLALV